MKRPYYPAIWFFLGALIASEPLSWLLGAPPGLGHQLLHEVGTVWVAIFGATSFAGFFGYAAGIALFRSHPPRVLSIAVGAAFGLALVAATRVQQFPGANFGPLALEAIAAGLVVGLVIGFRERRANYALKRTCAE